MSRWRAKSCACICWVSRESFLNISHWELRKAFHFSGIKGQVTTSVSFIPVFFFFGIIEITLCSRISILAGSAHREQWPLCAVVGESTGLMLWVVVADKICIVWCLYFLGHSPPHAVLLLLPYSTMGIGKGKTWELMDCDADSLTGRAKQNKESSQ